MLWNPGATDRGSRAGGSGIAGTAARTEALFRSSEKAHIGTLVVVPICTFLYPRLEGWTPATSLKGNGRHEETRTSDLYRVNILRAMAAYPLEYVVASFLRQSNRGYKQRGFVKRNCNTVQRHWRPPAWYSRNARPTVHTECFA